MQYAHEWGLRFAAFDVAEDLDGNLWFLECNPVGQWAWLETYAGFPDHGIAPGFLLMPGGLADDSQAVA